MEIKASEKDSGLALVHAAKERRRGGGGEADGGIPRRRRERLRESESGSSLDEEFSESDSGLGILTRLLGVGVE